MGESDANGIGERDWNNMGERDANGIGKPSFLTTLSSLFLPPPIPRARAPP